MNLIKTGNFCEITTDRLEDQGVKRGHLVYVAGHRVLPIDEADPYTQRIKFLIHLTSPTEINKTNLYLVDPNSIQPVTKRKQKKLDKQYGTNSSD